MSEDWRLGSTRLVSMGKLALFRAHRKYMMRDLEALAHGRVRLTRVRIEPDPLIEGCYRMRLEGVSVEHELRRHGVALLTEHHGLMGCDPQCVRVYHPVFGAGNDIQTWREVTK